jgi:4-hydroxy-3-methylbut-2-enyl diphosphate reductase
VVAGLQRTVAAAYAEMQACGGQVVILGKRGHAEVVGLAGHADGRAVIVEGPDDLDAVDFSRPVYFLAQTTQSLALFHRMADIIRERTRCPESVTIRDTICRQVSSREAKLREFAGRFDAVIFVSGQKSSNGKVLYGVCREANPNSYSIEDAGELQFRWLEGCRSVGICGATSTPGWLMRRVAERVGEMVGTPEE